MAWMSPWQEMDALRRQLDDAFQRGDMPAFPVLQSAFLPGRAARQYPLVNFYEDKDSIYVEALAPGIDPGSLNITMTGHSLTISGEKPRAVGEAKPEAFHREERAAGKFVRNIEVAAEVDEDNVGAEYKNGLLLIRLAKSEKAKPRQIDVQVV